MKTTYKTIEQPVKDIEFKDRGSKFWGFAFPIRTVQDVKVVMNELKKEHPKAVHHCFAYRVGTDGLEYRASDDGEPSGSAGRPILGQIDSFGITNVLVVVVRYFGGTLLGVPGLINAYKTTAMDTLKEAVLVEKWITKQVEIQFDYPAMREILYLLKQSEAEILHQDLQLFCTVKAAVPVTGYDACIAKVTNIRNVTVKQL